MSIYEQYFHLTGRKFDFLVVSGFDETVDQEMVRLKFRKIELKNATVYICGFNGWIPESGALLSGMCVQDRQVIFSPCVIDNIPKGNGEWITLQFDQHNVRIEADQFSNCPIFLSERLVSNSLHLMARCLPGAKANLSTLSSFFFINSAFSSQLSTFATALDGMSLLRQGVPIEFMSEGITQIRDPLPTSPVDVDEYRSLIAKAAQEISNNVVAMVKSCPLSFCALTGGRDSRVVYGALVSAGLIDQVKVSTNDIGRDLEIAKSLVSKFGEVHNSPGPSFYAYQKVINPDHCIDKFIGRDFFCTHEINKRVWPTQFIADTPHVLLGGGSGECYRNFHGQPFLSSPEGSASGDVPARREVYRTITSFAERNFPQPELMVSELKKTFSVLDGHTVPLRLMDHYLNFRNKFHFGNQEMAGQKMDFSPLQSRTLLELSRRVPESVMQSGQILFDVTRAYSEDLAFHEYDKNNTLAFSESRYFRKSSTHSALYKADATAYQKGARETWPVARAQPKVKSAKDFLPEIEHRIEALLDGFGKSPSPAVPNKILRRNFEWVKGSNPINLYRVYSRLRMLQFYAERQ